MPILVTRGLGPVNLRSRSSTNMNKREFLKSSGALLAGNIASRFVSGQHAQQPAPHENWAGNITYSTDA